MKTNTIFQSIKRAIFFVQILLVIVLAVNAAIAQTTEFTYQGRLVDGASPADASYDFEFRLFAVDTGGAAIGTVQRLGVQVSNGVFTVQLDFGGQFGGSDRWLEIAVKPAGSPEPFTTLNPRQPITSAPYSIRSMNAANATNALQLGGVAAGQYVLTTDPRMTDARNPLPNSASYVQNTTAQQASSNFNISGNGTAGGTLTGNVVNAQTQFNLGGFRLLNNAGSNNFFAGVSAGLSNTTGDNNAFFGASAGNQNTTGSRNAFVGSRTGNLTTTGNDNAFFGYAAGFNNSTGSRNAMFGSEAGAFSTTGNDNSFFGYFAGLNNTATGNSFFGSNAGVANTSGINNSFFGRNAGNENTTGNGNSFFGNSAGSNSTANANSFFGNSSGSSNTTGGANTFIGNAAGNTNTTGSNNTIIGANADVSSGNLSFATAIGAGAVASFSNTIVLGRSADNTWVLGQLLINTLASSGSTPLCRTPSLFVSTCSSSLRYKTDIQPFIGGLNLVNRLRPISFHLARRRTA